MKQVPVTCFTTFRKLLPLFHRYSCLITGIACPVTGYSYPIENIAVDLRNMIPLCNLNPTGQSELLKQTATKSEQVIIELGSGFTKKLLFI